MTYITCIPLRRSRYDEFRKSLPGVLCLQPCPKSVFHQRRIISLLAIQSTFLEPLATVQECRVVTHDPIGIVRPLNMRDQMSQESLDVPSPGHRNQRWCLYFHIPPIGCMRAKLYRILAVGIEQY